MSIADTLKYSDYRFFSGLPLDQWCFLLYPPSDKFLLNPDNRKEKSTLLLWGMIGDVFQTNWWKYLAHTSAGPSRSRTINGGSSLRSLLISEKESILFIHHSIKSLGKYVSQTCLTSIFVFDKQTKFVTSISNLKKKMWIQFYLNHLIPSEILEETRMGKTLLHHKLFLLNFKSISPSFLANIFVSPKRKHCVNALYGSRRSLLKHWILLCPHTTELDIPQTWNFVNIILTTSGVGILLVNRSVVEVP
jgi:hypothetical protein